MPLNTYLSTPQLSHRDRNKLLPQLQIRVWPQGRACERVTIVLLSYKCCVGSEAQMCGAHGALMLRFSP